MQMHVHSFSTEGSPSSYATLFYIIILYYITKFWHNSNTYFNYIISDFLWILKKRCLNAKKFHCVLLSYTSSSIMKTLSLTSNTHFTLIFDSVIYSELNMTYVCTPWIWLCMLAETCWSVYGINCVIRQNKS